MMMLLVMCTAAAD